ncbi:hypothetical protein FJ444_15855 [Aestuariibacter sp. GS-14]|uniref:flagellar hook-length control protein FliK n=1 Tax=Aestuariibacter sp. GS-14 TaxID=2590670 RepID=UPI001127B248|nr:flagellar hook-length control protein FliK [Aestuariibacter sp. GS-14]TPV56097.1 hypothetical protein FJ444_15855 [Aestuariibacter sp. GS-14]
MQPIQSTPSLSPESRQALLTALTEAGMKPEAVARFAQLMQVANPVQSGLLRSAPTTLQNSDKSLLIELAKRLAIKPADPLLLMRLSTALPIVQVQGQAQSLLQILPNQSLPNEIALLARLTPQQVSQPVDKALVQQLVADIAISNTQSIQVKATIATIYSDTVQLRVPANPRQDLLVPKVLLNSLRELKDSPEQLVGKSVVIEAKPTNGKWEIQLRLVSESPVNNIVSKAANSAEAANQSLVFARENPIVKSLIQAQLHQQGLRIERASELLPQSLTQLTAPVKEALQSASEALPVTLKASAHQLSARLLQPQPLLLDIAPGSALLSALPKVTPQTTPALAMSAAMMLKLPQTTLQVMTNPQTPAESQQGTQARNGKATSIPANQPTNQPQLTAGAAEHSLKPTSVNIPADKPLVSLLPAQSGIKTDIQQLIQTLQRFNAVNVEPTPANMADLTQTLKAIINQSAPESKQVLTNILLKLQTMNPLLEHNPVDVTPENDKPVTQPASPKTVATESLVSPQLLRQLFSSATWMQSTSVLTSPPAGQGMLSGLVQLFQIALLGKQVKSLDELERLLQQQPKASSGQGSPLQGIPVRLVRDVATADAQHNLLKQIKSLLSSHQQSKLSGTDQTLQGQDTFYYLLPAFQQQQKHTEILVKREPEQKSKERDSAQQQQWQLTMKLDVGELGQLLTKVKIVDTCIDLDIYTSNQILLEKVANTLPFLLKRFSQLGLEVGHHKAQLGKIPDSLATKPYQILETIA